MAIYSTPFQCQMSDFLSPNPCATLDPSLTRYRTSRRIRIHIRPRILAFLSENRNSIIDTHLMKSCSICTRARQNDALGTRGYGRGQTHRMDLLRHNGTRNKLQRTRPRLRSVVPQWFPSSRRKRRCYLGFRPGSVLVRCS